MAEDENATRRQMWLSDESSGGARLSPVEEEDSLDSVEVESFAELSQAQAERVEEMEMEHQRLRADVLERSRRAWADRYRRWVYGGLRVPPSVRAADGDERPGAQGAASQHPEVAAVR